MGRKKKKLSTTTRTSKPGCKPILSAPTSENPDSIDKLSINKDFAERYEVSKRKQLLRDVQPAHLFDSSASGSSSEEEEDEFGELLTKGVDRRVRETLEAIRNKDPKIYEKNIRFFEAEEEDEEQGVEDKDEDGDGDEEDDVEHTLNSDDEPVAGWDTIANAARGEVRKLTLKDYVRENLLQHGNLSDGEDENGQRGSDAERESKGRSLPMSEEKDVDASGLKGEGENRNEDVDESKRLHAHENEESGNDDSDDGDSDDENSDSEFFRKKEKSAADVEKEEKDFEVFLQKQQKKNAERAGEDLLLHSYLENEKPDEKERFLRDFVLNNGWLDKNAGDAPRADGYEIEIDSASLNRTGEMRDEDEDDEFEDRADEFEAKYNFRFEDPEGTQIVSHGRNIPDSMRRPDDRRKRAREARRLRKQQEKLAKTEEIKRLKNLKKTEIQARLFAIQEAAGDGVDLSGIDLEGDFDPDEFNRQMENKFGEDYYAANDEEMQELADEDVAKASDLRIEGKRSEETPEDIREDVNRLVDEYYNLNYEDIVGGAPMRFNYKRVEPESFSMTAEDILSLEDKELNRLISLKYLAPYQSSREVKKQSWRVRDKLKRQEIPGTKREGMASDNPESQSLVGEKEHQGKATEKNSSIVQENGQKEKKNKKKRKQCDDQEVVRRGAELTSNADANENGSTEIQEIDNTDAKRWQLERKESSSARKRKKRKAAKAEVVSGLSARRLEAYGISELR